MPWMIEYSDNFLSETKKLSKKFKLLKDDLKIAVHELEMNELGTPLGSSLYKKRVRNSSIPTGKSGGFRMIIYQKVQDNIILLSIFSKGQKESLSDNELRSLVQLHFNELK